MINHAASVTGGSSRDAIGQPLKTVFDLRSIWRASARAKQRFYNEAHSHRCQFTGKFHARSKDGVERVIEQVASPFATEPK